LYSAAFRRLAGVTQVVHVAEGHIFHNRLVHSIKVAQIGRAIAEFLVKETKPDVLEAVGGIDIDVVEAACLAHDLGHPPFGHIAESELDDSAKRHKVFDGFEGNPQSFRILTKVAIRDELHPGLDLTSATLNALLKYPWPRGTAGQQSRKWGHYHEEKGDFDFARSRETKPEQRSVEAEIMDWADDVAYSIHDVDDFYRAGLIPLDRILSGGAETDRFLGALEQEGVVDKEDKAAAAALIATLYASIGSKDILVPFQGTTAQFQALRRFESGLMRRFLGLDDPTFLKVSAAGSRRLEIAQQLRWEVNILKGLMRFYVYGAEALVAQQHGQRKLIRGLFDILFEAAAYGSETDAKIFPPSIGERLHAVKRASPDVTTNIVRLVTDTISSLTEQQAISYYRRLSGADSGLLANRIF
jgi:dGTPase